MRIPNREMERQSRRIAVRVRRRPRVRLGRELRRRGAGNRPGGSRPRHPVRQRRGRENVIYRAIAARRFRQDDGRRGGVDVPQLAVDPRRAEAWGGVVDPMRRVVGYGVVSQRRRDGLRIGAPERMQPVAVCAQRKRGYARAVAVEIARRHRVAECVYVARLVLGGVRHSARIGSDGERQIGRPGEFRAAVEADFRRDGFARLVAAAGRRSGRESHVRNGERRFRHDLYSKVARIRIAVRVRRRPAIGLGRRYFRRHARNLALGRHPAQPRRHGRGRERVAYRAVSARRRRQNLRRSGGVRRPNPALGGGHEHGRGVVDRVRRR